jgi:GxxExxY protein
MALRGIPFVSQKRVRVHYKRIDLGDDPKLDILVSERLIVELKAVEKLLPLHDSQLITYLKLTGVPTGLLINFNVRLLRDGMKRLVL